MRYQGQGWEIPVNLPEGQLKDDGAACLRQRFESEYSRLFARPLIGLDIEVMSWSVRVVSKVISPQQVQPAGNVDHVPDGGLRQVYDPQLGHFCDAALVERNALASGRFVSGPAIVVERETTTIITEAFEATGQPDGCLLIRRKQRSNNETH